jgi:hypothetical protein
MTRIFHPYTLWECYEAGFYASTVKGMTKEECEDAYREFLSDDKRFGVTLSCVITEWKHSCEHYLTNTAMNRIAWLGQTSACYALGIPSAFRGGFHLLSQDEQDRANQTALDALNKWLVRNGWETVTMKEAWGGGGQERIDNGT